MDSNTYLKLVKDNLVTLMLKYHIVYVRLECFTGDTTVEEATIIKNGDVDIESFSGEVETVLSGHGSMFIECSLSGVCTVGGHLSDGSSMSECYPVDVSGHVVPEAINTGTEYYVSDTCTTDDKPTEIEIRTNVEMLLNDIPDGTVFIYE